MEWDLDQPDPPGLARRGSFELPFPSPTDYVPGSLDNSPDHSPNATVRGRKTTLTGRKRYRACEDYFAAAAAAAIAKTISRASSEFIPDPEKYIRHSFSAYKPRKCHVSDKHAWTGPGLSRPLRYHSLSLPLPRVVKPPVFGPPICTCRCCPPGCSAASVSAEFANDSEIVGMELEALRTELHVLIDSVFLNVEAGTDELLESMGAFFNIAGALVDESDRIVTKFRVRWRHRVFLLPQPDPPLEFPAGDGDDLSLTDLALTMWSRKSPVDVLVCREFWQHCVRGFSMFGEVVDATDILAANQFVKRILRRFAKLKSQVKECIEYQEQRAARAVKLAENKKEKKRQKEVEKMEQEMRRDRRRLVADARRIDEVETISDDTVEVRGDDAAQLRRRRQAREEERAEAEKLRVEAERMNRLGGDNEAPAPPAQRATGGTHAEMDERMRLATEAAEMRRRWARRFNN